MREPSRLSECGRIMIKSDKPQPQFITKSQYTKTKENPNKYIKDIRA